MEPPCTPGLSPETLSPDDPAEEPTWVLLIAPPAEADQGAAHRWSHPTSAADYDLLESRSGCCSLVEPPCIRCGALTLPGLTLVEFHPLMNFLLSYGDLPGQWVPLTQIHPQAACLQICLPDDRQGTSACQDSGVYTVDQPPSSLPS